jgi:Domain of unknown function (DUF5655)
MPTPTVAAHFTGKAPVVRAIYERLLDTATRLGSVRQDAKKTSIHLMRRTAFAGVATRRDGIVLTLKSPSDVRSTRIMRREQASANRWYLYMKLTDPRQVDKQVAGWLARAFEMAQ